MKEVTKEQIERALTKGTNSKAVRKAAVKAIAEDVIVQILLRKYVGTHGEYFEASSANKCRVCAIGSAIVSEHALTMDKVNFKKMQLDGLSPVNWKFKDTIYERNNPGGSVFSGAELTELEKIFERELTVGRGKFTVAGNNRPHHGNQALLTIFSEILYAGGDVWKAINVMGKGNMQSERVLKKVEEIANSYKIKINDGTETCDMLTQLRESCIKFSED